jgi:hypothetical protein
MFFPLVMRPGPRPIFASLYAWPPPSLWHAHVRISNSASSTDICRCCRLLDLQIVFCSPLAVMGFRCREFVKDVQKRAREPNGRRECVETRVTAGSSAILLQSGISTFLSTHPISAVLVWPDPFFIILGYVRGGSVLLHLPFPALKSWSTSDCS